MKKVLSFLILCSFSFVFSQNKDYLLAENYFRNSEFKKASALFEKLSQTSPYNTTYLQRLVTCYQETQDYTKAEKLLLKRLKTYPKMIYLNVLIGHNYDKQQQDKKAQQFYTKAIDEIRKETSYGTSIAEMFRGYNLLDFAIKAYEKTASIKGGDYDTKIAELYGEKGDFAKMFELYFDYLDKRPGNTYALKYKASQYVTDDSENSTNKLLKKALLKRSLSKPKDDWNELLAWLFTKQKDYLKAFIQYKAIYTRGKNQRLYNIIQLAKVSFDDKAYKEAKTCYEFVREHTQKAREKFEAIDYLVKIAIATNQPNIEETFKVIFETYGINTNTLPIQLTYANYLTFNKNNPKKAKEVLEKAIGLPLSSYQRAELKLELANVLVYQNTFNKALIYYSQIQSKYANHPLGQQARFKVAQTSYFKGDFDWAKAQAKVLKGSATQLIANDATALFLIISDNQPKDSLPTGLKAFAKASLLAYQNQNEKAIAVLEKLKTAYKGQPIEDDVLYEQAKLYTKIKVYDKAIANYKRIIEMDKEGGLVDDSLFNLAEIYYLRGEFEKAKPYYERIVLEYVSSIYVVDARKKYRELRK